MILQNIHQKINKQQSLLAVLLDPEKIVHSSLSALVNQIHEAPISHIFIGGSTDENAQIKTLVKELKKLTHLPLVLFPGHADQVVPQADAILFLSLLSGRNPRYLIDHHIQAVPTLIESNIEIIPTGYILVDGGKRTKVQEVSETKPIPQDQLTRIVHTALAGQYMGKKLIYLEAGSGANYPVSTAVIHAVKKQLSIPLIVGGGIRTKTQIEQAYLAGADLVVIGTAFENDPNFFNTINS
ncbi:geranylgeranylglyceryl/heptaprenylglyceryl phosphate synthase [Flavobacteriaceae bacterium F08102]|nr:geranylgeranylglyceryl/heptaprenylglyceryl phosphate synthase [Flavobacteriaceae bacterium F08102]